MAYIFDSDITEQSSLDAFSEAASSVDLNNEAEIISLAPEMKKLCNNIDWLQNFILEGLKSPESFQQENLYSSQSYILRNIGERAFLRFAIWAPKKFSEQLDEDNFFSYKTAHNHDFSLLTAGYLGPGYTTSIYHADNPEAVVGYPGEDVNLSLVDKFTLSQGRVAFYEAGKDIHIQHEPAGLSISLNLIVAQPQMNIRQLYYDTVANKVSGYIGNTAVQRGLFFKFAAALPTESNHKALLNIVNTNDCEITRAYAYRALSESFEKRANIAEMMKSDNSKLVQSSVHLLNDSIKNMHVWG